MKTILIILLIGISLSYNPWGAINYANAYCSSYNPAFNNYKGRGGDCANFVSQCLTAGGFSLAGCGGTDNKGMIPGVSNLKNCLTSRGWRVSGSMPPNFQMGYPIFAKAYSHAMLATGISGGTSGGYVFYCAHTTDRCNARIPMSDVDFYYL